MTLGYKVLLEIGFLGLILIHNIYLVGYLPTWFSMLVSLIGMVLFVVVIVDIVRYIAHANRNMWS